MKLLNDIVCRFETIEGVPSQSLELLVCEGHAKKYQKTRLLNAVLNGSRLFEVQK